VGREERLFWKGRVPQKGEKKNSDGLRVRNTEFSFLPFCRNRKERNCYRGEERGGRTSSIVQYRPRILGSEKILSIVFMGKKKEMCVWESSAQQGERKEKEPIDGNPG